MSNLTEKVLEATKRITDLVSERPSVGIVLGSGLGDLAYEVQNPIEIPFSEIPYFKTSTVSGHDGKLIFGKIYDEYVVVMKGRIHYYEGYSMEEITFPIRVMAMLGIKALILTNSAGGISPKYKVGDLMFITDHINIGGISPLRGENDENFGPRFPSMTDIYDKTLISIAKSVANELKISYQEGIYAFMPGPQYETNAEIKMLSIIGATAVGMSTVPEAIVAAHSGIPILAISCITNVTGKQNADALSHEEVLDAANNASQKFIALIMDTIDKLR